MKSAYGIISSMPVEIAASLMTNTSLISKTERARRNVVYARWKAEEARKSSIRLNVCPLCEGKLVRGKRSKKNDHKREWSCQKCGEVHYI